MAEPLGELVRTHYCGELREGHVGKTVTLMGWAATRRDLGGVIFLDLRDREGLCQVVARPEVSTEAHAAADRVRSEYVVAVVGEVVARTPENVNPDMATGKVEVHAREIRVLSEAKTPVFEIGQIGQPAGICSSRVAIPDVRSKQLYEAPDGVASGVGEQSGYAPRGRLKGSR